ncbi:hypothetical protein CC78DRAFT_61893 [Lojkania enalia]|uniref:Uncharacterized protein n=1 Tax=Lojkania enalia TaxID=147567 RepID=A0A9P4N6K3_9PLEO|nr:hypothetical protein CC78DRAFT_61893 [Didymosphaeria enalia]
MPGFPFSGAFTGLSARGSGLRCPPPPRGPLGGFRPRKSSPSRSLRSFSVRAPRSLSLSSLRNGERDRYRVFSDRRLPRSCGLRDRSRLL